MDHTKTTVAIYDRIAKRYEDAFMGLALYNDTYDLFCDLAGKPCARIFEIACGPGNITKYLLTKRPDFQITAIDLAPNMVKLAQANNPSAKVEIMDCRGIDRIQTFFDAVMCGFCLPYLPKEETAKLIRDSADLLVSGGICYFSAIEGEYARSGYETSSDGKESMFVYRHEAAFLSEKLEKSGFDVIAVERKSYPRAAGSETHVIFIARKK